MPEEITNEAANSQLILGLDLGSYAIRHGLVDSTDGVHDFRSEPYEPDSMSDGLAMIDQIRRLIARKLAGPSGGLINGVSIAVPGMVHALSRRLHGATGLPKLPHLADLPHLVQLASIDLQSRLEREFTLPVAIENNARAAAFGPSKAVRTAIASREAIDV
ncbi:MAG: ROK family protein, partial [Acidobacteria bacterium]|nr:ROK family protein [Acidobacteriota bacterium]